MPISDFRKKKLLYVFNVFFDVNGSGTVDKKDFEDAIEKICSKRGWASSTPEYKKVHDSLIAVWEGLKQQGDGNNDGEISADEWLTMWDGYAASPNNPAAWQTKYQKFLYDLEDASGDGSIDVKEFTDVCSCYGVSTSESQEAFQKMADGKNKINYEQFGTLFKQYFTSENPADPGNFIFGKTKF